MYRKAGIGKTIQFALKDMKNKYGLDHITNCIEILGVDNVDAAQTELYLFLACCAYNAPRELTSTERRAFLWFKTNYSSDWERYINIFKYSKTTAIAIKDTYCYRFIGMNGVSTKKEHLI